MQTTIAPGTRLGPYEIQDLIGAGGMGEVYRARDARLGRDVAVKILPRSFAADSDRLRRFQREARAAGQLNHPNVIAIHDIGTSEGVPYIVSELIDGEDLRTRLNAGPLPVRKALACAVQIAKGLAAAHDKGIAHRDLKPENIMILPGDHVKILDFGLAKLIHAETPDDDKTRAMLTELTQSGTILGTASYMSPEQIRQQPSDHRTDIFALGSILYEMLSGRRAFEGETHADRMSAILNSDPPSLPGEVEETAPGIGALIQHCLEKRAEDRFETARDLAFALGLVDSAAAAARRGGAEPAGPARVAPARRHTFRRTTYREGSILSARFAADGQAICYGAAWEGRPVELFWAYPGSPESRALGYPRTDLLSIAPSGEMAVSLRRHARGGFVYTGMLARMPVGGGAPRELLDGVFEADWSPDGRNLAVVREEAGMTRIEFPIGTLLHQTAGWVSHVRVSPQGKHVAFLDHPVRGDDMGAVAVVDLNGRVKTLSSGWLSARGLAWSPDGQEVVFSAFRTGVGRSLYAATLDGAERPLLEVPGHMTLLDISRQGAGLIVLENERARIQHLSGSDSAPRDLSWLDWTLVRALSQDGARILFDETGVGGGELHSVYLRGTDGSPAVRLGDGACFDLSPDGLWALAGVSLGEAGGQRLDLLPCGAGSPRTIPTEGIEVHNAVWFPDGATLCVLGQIGGGGARLYKLDGITGRHEPFTGEGISSYDLHVSPDGRFVAAQGPDRKLMLYPVDGGEPHPVLGIAPGDRTIGWSPDGSALFVFTRGELPAKVCRIDIATGERKLWRQLSPPDGTGVEGLTSVRMTPDANSFAYSYAQRLNDLYVVEGLF